jgi:hypothetical protein
MAAAGTRIEPAFLRLAQRRIERLRRRSRDALQMSAKAHGRDASVPLMRGEIPCL